MTTLYVIGNGFDLHHGMETSYKHFGTFLKRKHHDLYCLLDEYFPTYDADDFWGHFEERLADFDSDTLVGNSEHFIVSYSAEDWSDAFHHDYTFELEKVVQTLSGGILSAFAEWIGQIIIPSRDCLPAFLTKIDPTAQFINFNYTETLQRLYGVPDAKVWHIHGAAARSGSLVLGHGWLPKPTETWVARLDPEREDPRVIEGANIIDRYFESSFKPTTKIIANNAARFAALTDVEDIRVLGHSLSDVDLPYLKKIAASARPMAQWRVSLSGESTSIEAQFAKFASPTLATFCPLSDV